MIVSLSEMEQESGGFVALLRGFWSLKLMLLSGNFHSVLSWVTDNQRKKNCSEVRSIVFLIQHDTLKAIYFIWITTKEIVIFAIARITGCLEYIEEWFIFHCPVQNLKGFSWVILIILRFFHYVTYPLYNIWLYCNRMLCLLLEGILISSHFSIFG